MTKSVSVSPWHGSTWWSSAWSWWCSDTQARSASVISSSTQANGLPSAQAEGAGLPVQAEPLVLCGRLAPAHHRQPRQCQPRRETFVRLIKPGRGPHQVARQRRQPRPQPRIQARQQRIVRARSLQTGGRRMDWVPVGQLVRNGTERNEWPVHIEEQQRALPRTSHGRTIARHHQHPDPWKGCLSQGGGHDSPKSWVRAHWGPGARGGGFVATPHAAVDGDPGERFRSRGREAEPDAGRCSVIVPLPAETTWSLLGRFAARYGMPVTDLRASWEWRNHPPRSPGASGVQPDAEVLLDPAGQDLLAAMCRNAPHSLERALPTWTTGPATLTAPSPQACWQSGAAAHGPVARACRLCTARRTGQVVAAMQYRDGWQLVC